MNIKEAAKHVKSTIDAYLEKDEYNDYVIPIEKQRPIFLYGPPGIGKTAIVEQIANELDIGIVTYSMTHHTRQSALGLPFIKTMEFGGTAYQVSEYTMSEILASVYEYIEETGKTNGILFLDEINCVSETLLPSMLRFLQYKTFGSHKVPDGWVIVTAGNPSEYNKSAREYDIATLDRIQKISIDADYDVWREYAVKRNIHPSIISFLDVNKQKFYYIENTPVRKEFITARGWEDLSRLIFSFEKNAVEITVEFIEQYIQVNAVAEDFFEFYSVFKNMQSVYSIEDIMSGKGTSLMSERLRQAHVSEKIGFINYLSDGLYTELSKIMSFNKTLKAMATFMKDKDLLDGSDEQIAFKLKEAIKEKLISDKKENNVLINKIKELISYIEDNGKNSLSQFINNELSVLKEMFANSEKMLSNSSKFMYDTFGESPEMRIFITDITTNKETASFLIAFGCQEFSVYAKGGFSQEEINQKLDEMFRDAK